VGKTGYASPQKAMLFGDPRPAQPTPCGFAPFRASEEQGEAYKTGELAENRRFFDKQKRPPEGSLLFVSQQGYAVRRFASTC
jgi:hypothetical protein